MSGVPGPRRARVAVRPSETSGECGRGRVPEPSAPLPRPDRKTSQTPSGVGPLCPGSPETSDPWRASRVGVPAWIRPPTRKALLPLRPDPIPTLIRVLVDPVRILIREGPRLRSRSSSYRSRPGNAGNVPFLLRGDLEALEPQPIPS